MCAMDAELHFLMSLWQVYPMPSLDYTVRIHCCSHELRIPTGKTDNFAPPGKPWKDAIPLQIPTHHDSNPWFHFVARNRFWGYLQNGVTSKMGLPPKWPILLLARCPGEKNKKNDAPISRHQHRLRRRILGPALRAQRKVPERAAVLAPGAARRPPQSPAAPRAGIFLEAAPFFLLGGEGSFFVCFFFLWGVWFFLLGNKGKTRQFGECPKPVKTHRATLGRWLSSNAGPQASEPSSPFSTQPVMLRWAPSANDELRIHPEGPSGLLSLGSPFSTSNLGRSSD